MAIATYTDLIGAVEDWLDRNDLSDSLMNTFVSLAEADIFQKLRISEMETTNTVAISSSVIPVPTGYLDLKEAYIDSSPSSPVTFTAPFFIQSRYPNSGETGIPKFIARRGTNFIFGPNPDSDYDVIYTFYKEPTSLATSLTTNTIFPKVSTLYFYGTLIQAATYLGLEEKLGIWSATYERLLNGFNGTHKDAVFSGGLFVSTPLVS